MLAGPRCVNKLIVANINTCMLHALPTIMFEEHDIARLQMLALNDLRG